VKAIADALGVSRSNLSRKETKKRGPYDRAGDVELLARIRPIVDARGSYGYRRVTALLNRALVAEGMPRVNHKRVFRVMRKAGLLLARYTGKSTRTHEGTIITMKSDMRWCSDGFEIRCWNGERVQVAFSLDCHDREAMRFVATSAAITGEMIRDLMAETLAYRFGTAARTTPTPIEWLSDNGPPYTANETCEFGRSIGLLIRTTPAYSPESNGMAEVFVKTFKRDFVYLSRLETAEAVMQKLPTWFDDYNNIHPHKALRMQSPREYRSAQATG